MAATFSIQDYLQHFFLNRDDEIFLEVRRRNDQQQNDGLRSRSSSDNHPPQSPTKVLSTAQQNYGIMLANVYQILSGGVENLIYSKRITGNKNIDVFGILVQDMIGAKGIKASQSGDGRLSRASSVSDVSSIFDSEEGELQPHTTVRIQLMSSRTPSNVGSSQLLVLLEHCKRHAIRATIHLKFAHAYSWDNKYNREGIEKLGAKGVKFQPMSFQQTIQAMIDDLMETLESFDQMETCRGTILINPTHVNQAVTELRHCVTTRSDFYAQDQQERLNEILGRETVIPKSVPFLLSDIPAVFSLETYRDYILLQNADITWGKLKVGVTKIANGVTKEVPAYETVHKGTADRTSGKSTKNNNHRLLDKQIIWQAIGKKVTMVDLAECETIILTVSATLSEYCGRTGWVDEITQLHTYLRDKIEESELYKVTVETVVKYAQANDAPIHVPTKSRGRRAKSDQKLVNGDVTGHSVTTVGFPKGMRLECLHIQDILFEMLEDLEDSLRHLGTLDYGRGANLSIGPEGLARAIGLINKSIKVRTGGKEYSMNEDFVDNYADEMNMA